ncbi:hypothetical protein DTL42_03825 [Bremerella cremea]|uniref:Carboxypeptidase regulatory-like domain-containing protein n=2 Tax=Bremerella cremea TaxID=1031537 RepID=A0A368KV25_9BACT|nr:hypothetical protein DTL42_03825 [Bremerella cremea]
MAHVSPNITARFFPFNVSLVGLLLCLSFGGCGSNSGDMVGVAGQITFDGKPVEKGEIRFTVDGHATEASRIEMGKYEVNVPKGKSDIQIFAYRQAKGKEMAVTSSEPINVNYIPAKYNTESTLNAELEKTNKNLDFTLMP